MVGARSLMLPDRDAEAREFFAFEADSHAEFEAAARDDINRRNSFGKT